MFNIFIILLSVHFLVDYFLQNNEFISRKNQLNFTIKDFYKHPFIIHVILQTLLSLIILLVYNPENNISVVYLILSLFLHGIIDLLKIYARSIISSRYNGALYILDQLLHISILFTISYFIVEYFGKGKYFQEFTDNIIFFKYTLVIILITKVANITFKEVFANYSGEDMEIELIKRKNKNTTSTRLVNVSNRDIGNENAGAVIGSMERLLIMICLVTNNFGTIGFVLAAKSVARFKNLDKQKFGEYFIIGTLFSILYTIGVFYIVFKVL